MLFDVFAGRGIGIGYFVISLTQVIILNPLIARIRSLWVHVVIIVGLTILGKVFTYLTAIGPANVQLDFPFSAIPFFVWYPFFHLGYLLSHQRDLTVRHPRYLALGIFLVVVGISASVQEGLWLMTFDATFALSQLKASSSLCSLGIFLAVVFAFPLLESRFPRWLSWVGRNSYVVYLSHLIPLKILAGAAVAVGLSIGSPLHILIVPIATFVVCCLAVWAGRALIPAEVQKYVFG